LVPRVVGRKRGLRGEELPVAQLCWMCHGQIHTLYTNKELAQRLSSLEALRSDPAVARYVEWVQKQDGETVFRARKRKIVDLKPVQGSRAPVVPEPV
jgi:5-methylcytosine-specific restriction protein A